MTKMNIDDLWEKAWREGPSSESPPPSADLAHTLSSLDPQAFENLTDDELVELAEWSALQDALRDRPAPKPSADFADRMVAQLQQIHHEQLDERPAQAGPIVPAPSKPGRSHAWLGAVGVLATAAALMLALRWWGDDSDDFLPGPNPIVHNTKSTNPSDVTIGQKTSPAELRQQLAASGQEYLGVVREMTTVFATSTDDPQDPTPATNPDGVDPLDVTADDAPVGLRLPTPKVDRLLTDSTVSVADAGRGLEIGLRPLGQSAVGAFGFLLPGQQNATTEQDQ